jgi:hypothetical protein
MQKVKSDGAKGTQFHEMLCHSLGQPRKYSSIEALRSQCCVACSACVGARVRDRGKDVRGREFKNTERDRVGMG